MRSVVVACSLALPFTNPAVAQVEWSRVGDVTARNGHTLVYDSGRDRVVLFGGEGGEPFDETWEWDGTAWCERLTATRPPARYAHSMVYDTSRNRVVVFGGLGGDAAGNPMFGDTWEFDGMNWSLRSTTGPSPRRYAAMAFDLVSQRTLLFGGSTSDGSTLDDTWAWDGNTWTQLAPTSHPSARQFAALGFDPSRLRATLYGGIDGQGTRSGETWEWNPFTEDWSLVTPPQSPPPSTGRTLQYDHSRQRLIGRFADVANPGNPSLWAWNGSTWRLLPAATTSPRSWTSSMAYDIARNQLVLMGGLRLFFYEESTWVWDGVDWSQVSAGPSPRGGYRLAFDDATGVGVMIGSGSTSASTTWEWRGAWQPAPALSEATWLEWTCLAFHPASARFVRFGGFSIGTSRYVDETWTYDGTTWAREAPSTSPPPTIQGALALDPVSGDLIHFGGIASPAGRSDETWAWNGSTWRRLTPATTPGPRSLHAMAFDKVRNRIVLFGGEDDGGALDDTWEWNGADWSERLPAARPPALAGHAMAYDAARQRTVLFGSSAGSDETWEWDGTTWTRRRPVAAPRGRTDFAMAYDAAGERVLVFGGARSQPAAELFGDTWTLTATSPARYEAFGAGCTGSVGTPTIRSVDDARPWVGATIAVRISPLPANAAVALTFAASAPAPIDLGLIGMTGCDLLVGPGPQLHGTSNAIGRADIALTVPDRTTLLGYEFFNQAFALDPAANSLGVVASDARRGVVGNR